MHVGCSSSGWRSSAAKSLLGLRLSAACFSPLRLSARAGLSSEYVCCSDLKAEAMTGSSSSSSKEPLLEKAFSVAPCNLVRKVQILLDGRRAYAAPSGAWKRKQESILKPARDCYETLSLESIEGDDAVRFSCGHLVRILNYIALACDWYWQRLQSISHEKVGLVLFGDEATGGNVLCTASSKKVFFFYLALVQLGETHRPDAWLPFAAIPHRDFSRVKGGLSKCLASVLASLKAQLLTKGLVRGVPFEFQIHGFLADYDGFRACFLAKGASALKPCFLCQNVVMKNSDVVMSDPSFKTISSFDVESFQPIDSRQLWSLCDAYIPEIESMTQASKTNLERLLGFSLDPDSLLADKEVRDMLPLDLCILDSCHCYYANGIFAQEIVLLQTALATHFDVDLTLLAQSMVELPWWCKDERFSAKGTRKHWFHPSLWEGSLYKGQASVVWYILPWLWFYAKTLSGDRLLPEIQCFEALMEATYIQKHILYMLTLLIYQ